MFLAIFVIVDSRVVWFSMLKFIFICRIKVTCFIFIILMIFSIFNNYMHFNTRCCVVASTLEFSFV